MRKVLRHVDSRDVLHAQEVNRLRLLLAEDRDQDVAWLNFFLAALLNVKQRPLQHALESQCGLRLGILIHIVRHARCGIVDRLDEIAGEPVDIGAASLENFDYLRRVEQSQEQVLDRDELMSLVARPLIGFLEANFQLSR